MTLAKQDRRCPQCEEEKPASEFHKDGRHPECKACVSRRNAAYREKHAATLKVQKKAYAERNKAAIAESNRRYRQANSDAVRAKDALKHQKNKEYRNGLAREWRQANPHVVNALAQKAKAAKLNAVPPWADLEAIKAIYKEARRLTKESGIEHHVDHIVPLQSPLVCGLHCESNLRVITWLENQSKHNRLLPEVVALPSFIRSSDQ